MLTQYQSFLAPFMLEIEQDTNNPTDLYHKMNDYILEFKRMTFFFVNAAKEGIQTKLTQ